MCSKNVMRYEKALTLGYRVPYARRVQLRRSLSNWLDEVTGGENPLVLPGLPVARRVVQFGLSLFPKITVDRPVINPILTAKYSRGSLNSSAVDGSSVPANPLKSFNG